MAEHGLLNVLANGVYVLTDEGEAYLEGDYDAEEGAYMDASETPEAEAGNTEASGEG